MKDTRTRRILAALVTLACGSTAFQYGGCDTVGAVDTWGGLAQPWNTSSLGLPESPPSYWARLGYGTENVDTWDGLANSWYTSSIGLPVAPW